MRELSYRSQPCFSVRLFQPFVRLLRTYPQFPQEQLAKIGALHPDERLPIATANELLAGAVAITGDPDLGLKAARAIRPGEYGALEYAARSSSTWGEAFEVTGRYMRLVNDALQFAVRREGERALIVLDSKMTLPRAAADFQSAAFFVSASHFWPEGAVPEYEVWFTHPEPDDMSEYARTFVGATMRFSSPFNAFVFASRYLDLPIQSADPQLNAVIRQHAELLLAELPKAQSFTERVRELIARELEGGTPTANHIARQLSISARTLSRRLEDEGTAFQDLLDDLRRRLALRYLSTSNLSVSEIAFLLGFSQSSAFHRAFKRWTSQTPLEYRHGLRG
jgi:AraC-like DNA-binding protein